MLKKALYYLVNTISALVIAAALFVLLSVVMTRQNETPNVLGYSAFRVVTGSMEPDIAQGELIVVKRVSGDEIAVGDVITFYSQDPQLQGAVNTHRVTDIRREGGTLLFITKGDANQTEDQFPVREADLIGKVAFSSKLLGTLSRLAANPLVFVPLILIPLLVMLLSNMVKTIRLAKEAVRAEEKEAVAEALRQIQRCKAEQKTEKEQDTGIQEENIES